MTCDSNGIVQLESKLNNTINILLHNTTLYRNSSKISIKPGDGLDSVLLRFLIVDSSFLPVENSPEAE